MLEQLQVMNMADPTRPNPFSPHDAVALVVRLLREQGGLAADIEAAFARGLVIEAMARAESAGANFKDASGFQAAGHQLSLLLDEIRRLALANLDISNAGN